MGTENSVFVGFKNRSPPWFPTWKSSRWESLWWGQWCPWNCPPRGTCSANIGQVGDNNPESRVTHCPGNKHEACPLRGEKGQCHGFHVGQANSDSHSEASQWSAGPRKECPPPPSSSSSCLCAGPRKSRPQGSTPQARPAGPYSTSAPGRWVLTGLQVVGECCQLPSRADAQPCASFPAFFHVEPWVDTSIITSSAHPNPASQGVAPQSHSPGYGTGALTPQGRAAGHTVDAIPEPTPQDN